MGTATEEVILNYKEMTYGGILNWMIDILIAYFVNFVKLMPINYSSMLCTITISFCYTCSVFNLIPMVEVNS